MNNKSTGHFVISLDFELIWGVFDVLDFSSHFDYFQNTRKVIPQILSRFRENNIHSTWATVGMLFNDGWREWETNCPDVKPSYKDPNLSAYAFVESAGKSGLDEICFAPGIISDIVGTPGQELSTHTYSHYYCNEEGQTVEQFREDLKMAIALAKKQNVRLKSLVFPRNQYNEKYLKVCSELGIESVRSNPADWYWKNPNSEALLTRLARTGDAYNIFGKRKSYSLNKLKQRDGLPLAQMASRFLRPVEENSLLRKLKMKRIKNEMTAAARYGEVYHLWWHPHNFGHNPEQSLRDLEEIIFHFKSLQKKYGFQSTNMEELRDFIIKKA